MANINKNQRQYDKEVIEALDVAKVAQKVKHDFPLNRWEACAYLGISKRQLEEFTLRGDLIPLRQGRRVFYKGSTLRSYVENLTGGKA